MSKRDAPPRHHVLGGFQWEKAPSCCDLLKGAFEGEFMFVGNIRDGEHDMCYMVVLDSEGEPRGSDGSVAITFCPWCGEKIQVRKK